MHKEDRTLRGFLSNEEHNPPSNSPTSAPSISPSAVDVKSDIGEREDVRPTEASAIDGGFGGIYFIEVHPIFDPINRSQSTSSTTNRFRSLACRSCLRSIRDASRIDMQIVSVSHHKNHFIYSIEDF